MSALHRAAWMSLLVVAGAGIYFGTMYVLGLRVQHLRTQRIAIPPRARESET
jgi:hypothetical protein